MSAEPDGRELYSRLETLIADARAAGRMHELARSWSELTDASDRASASARDGALDSTGPSETSEPRENSARDASDTSASAERLPGRFGIIGDSAPMQALFDLIAKVAPSGVSVLIQGETGTGKELVARALHEHSARKAKPFLAENCAAVPANLLESELFGHKRGSFTGAIADRAGHFVAAQGGTVFLDEIGDMPLAMQSKLLRVLQEGEVRPVGSNTTLKVDVRIVAATNKDLSSMCRAKTFREDLYYRLNVVNLVLPPLRERKGDVPLLVRHFLAKIQRETGRATSITPDALLALESARWPGNVRELENAIQRAAVFSRGTITKAELAPSLGAGV